MKDTTYNIWQGNTRRLMDFARREVIDAGLPEHIAEHILHEIREPLKEDSIVCTAIIGPRMTGFISGMLVDQEVRATSILVARDCDQKETAKGLVRFLFNTARDKGNVETMEVTNVIVGGDYMSEPLFQLGFMVLPQAELYLDAKDFKPGKPPEGYQFTPWKPDIDSEVSLVIALSDLGDTQTKGELPEREPRQRWLASMKEELGGQFDPETCFHAYIHSTLTGIVISSIDDKNLGQIRTISVAIDEVKKLSDEKLIEGRLVELAVQGLIAKGAKLIKVTVPEFRTQTINNLQDIGFVVSANKPDGLILSSDTTWDQLSS
jgi:hypothetical protein